MSQFIASPDGTLFIRKERINVLKKAEEGEPVIRVWVNSDPHPFQIDGFPDEAARDSWIAEIVDPCGNLVHTAHLPSPSPDGEDSGTVPSDGKNENQNT